LQARSRWPKRWPTSRIRASNQRRGSRPKKPGPSSAPRLDTSARCLLCSSGSGHEEGASSPPECCRRGECLHRISDKRMREERWICPREYGRYRRSKNFQKGVRTQKPPRLWPAEGSLLESATSGNRPQGVGHLKCPTANASEVTFS